AAASTTRYYLSLNQQKDANDILLTGSRSVLALNVGATAKGTVTATIPSTTPVGTYFVLACADDANAVTESNEANNCLASTTTVQVTLPDLVETAITNPPATANRGSSFRVTDTAKNQGLVPAAASTTRYYLSVDQQRDGSDILLTGSRSV